MKKKLFLSLGGIVVMAIILFAAYRSKPNLSGGKQQESFVINDTLQFQQTQISSFDPIDAYHAGHIQIVKQIYNTLAEIDSDGNIIPSLAEKWDTKDGINWIFKLREGVYFAENECFKNQESRLFSAADVKYSIERMLNNDSKSLGIAYFSNILGLDDYQNGKTNEIKGIKVEDDYTVDFTLKEKDLNFYKILSLPYASIVKKDAVEYYKDDFKMHPVGTGPFVLEKYEADKEIILAKNKNYWEKQNGARLPFADKVNISLATDDNLALLSFKNQKSDFLELTFPLKKQLENMDLAFPYNTETEETAQLNFYLFNLEKIQDKNTRKAISSAINRDDLKQILSDEGNIASSIYPPAIFKPISGSKSSLAYNHGKAMEILSAQAINPLKIVSFEDTLSKSIAEFIARSLKEYNIQSEIESVPFPVLVDRLTKGEYDLIQIYWGPIYSDANHYLAPFLSSSLPPAGNNFNKYQNPEFDKLANEAKSFSGSEQNDRFLKAEDVILEDMPFLLLYFKNTIRVSDKKYNFPLHPLGYRMYKYVDLK